MNKKIEHSLSVSEFMNAGKLGKITLPTYESPTITVGGLFTKEEEINKSAERCFANLSNVRKCILTWTTRKSPFISMTAEDILGIIVFGSTVNHNVSNISNAPPPRDIDLMIITKKSFNGRSSIIRSRWVDMTTGVRQVTSGNLPVSIDNRSSAQLLNGIKDGDDTVATNCIKDGVIIVSTPDLMSLINSTEIKQISPYKCYWSKSLLGCLNCKVTVN